MRSRPTGNIHRLEMEEAQYRGGNLEARKNHLREELEEVRKLKQVGRYSGRHKGEGEKDQCPRCTYERHEAGQKCPAEERSCNTCGEKGYFATTKMCTKKKTARRFQEEQRDTSSESSDTEGEQEVNRVIWERAWPGTSMTARRRDVRLIRMESGDESSSNDKSDTEGEEEEDDQANRERVWPGTREKARKSSIGHAIHKTEPNKNLQAENVNKTSNEGRGQDAKEQGRGVGLG
jgi:hypothetical protein